MSDQPAPEQPDLSDPSDVPDQAAAGRSEATGEEMLGSPTPEPAGDATATERDPSDWVTGGDPATEAQKTYLDRLAREAGEQIPADLTKAEASEHIDRLQAQTGTQPRPE